MPIAKRHYPILMGESGDLDPVEVDFTIRNSWLSIYSLQEEVTLMQEKVAGAIRRGEIAEDDEDASITRVSEATRTSVVTAPVTITGAKLVNPIVGRLPFVNAALELDGGANAPEYDSASKALTIRGALNISAVSTLTGAVNALSTLTVTGAGIFSSTLAVTGAGTFAATLGVTGAVTFDSTLQVDGVVTIGDGGEEDQIVGFNGAAQDYHVGIDDTDDTFNLGLGLVPGTTALITMFSDQSIEFNRDITTDRYFFDAGTVVASTGQGLWCTSDAPDDTNFVFRMGGKDQTRFNGKTSMLFMIGGVEYYKPAANGNRFRRRVEIDGQQDVIQLLVTGHSTQTAKIVVIENNAFDDLVTIDNLGNTDIAGTLAVVGALTLTVPLAVPQGGTGAATFTDGGIMLGSGTGILTALGQATDGQLPIGSTGLDPVLALIAGTANEITVTNGAGTITLSLPTDVTIGGILTVTGNLNHDGTNIGFFGTAPAAQAAAYTRDATIVEDRTLLASASATTINNNNVLAALIADLQSYGLIQ